MVISQTGKTYETPKNFDAWAMRKTRKAAAFNHDEAIKKNSWSIDDRAVHLAINFEWFTNDEVYSYRLQIIVYPAIGMGNIFNDPLFTLHLST